MQSDQQPATMGLQFSEEADAILSDLLRICQQEAEELSVNPVYATCGVDSEEMVTIYDAVTRDTPGVRAATYASGASAKSDTSDTSDTQPTVRDSE